jgi:hypothetical protein
MKRTIRIEIKTGAEIQIGEARKIIAAKVDILAGPFTLSKTARAELEKAGVFIWDRMSEQFFKKPGE